MQATKIEDAIRSNMKHDGAEGKEVEAKNETTPFIVKSAKLTLKNTGIHGVCSCVCISDCSCDTSW